MTRFPLREPHELGLATQGDTPRSLWLLTADEYDDWLAGIGEESRAWITNSGFAGVGGTAILLPPQGEVDAIAVIDPAHTIWNAAAIATFLRSTSIRSVLAGRWHNTDSPPIATRRTGTSATSTLARFPMMRRGADWAALPAARPSAAI